MARIEELHLNSIKKSMKIHRFRDAKTMLYSTSVHHHISIFLYGPKRKNSYPPTHHQPPWPQPNQPLYLPHPNPSQELLHACELIIRREEAIKSIRNIPSTLYTAEKSTNKNSLQHSIELVDLILILSETWVTCP